jgi:hypothetical protein
LTSLFEQILLRAQQPAHAEDSQNNTQGSKPKFAMTLLIHRVEVLNPQSTVVNKAITLIDPAVRGRHGGLQRRGSFEYIFEQSGS